MGMHVKGKKLVTFYRLHKHGFLYVKYRNKQTGCLHIQSLQPREAFLFKLAMQEGRRREREGKKK